MEKLKGPAWGHGAQRLSELPVMVDEWAEAVIDLARLQSRRRHPSNQEPAWEKDGGYAAREWVI